jgi:carotenoid cleavage dioxygenase-like enzyme
MINAHTRAVRIATRITMTTKPGWFLFDGVVKVDLETGVEERYEFGDGVFGSETPMAPWPARPSRTAATS